MWPPWTTLVSCLTVPGKKQPMLTSLPPTHPLFGVAGYLWLALLAVVPLRGMHTQAMG